MNIGTNCVKIDVRLAYSVMTLSTKNNCRLEHHS